MTAPSRGSQFVPSFTNDASQDVAQRDVRRALDQLEDLRRGMLVASPLVGLADLQVSEHMVIVYKGLGGNKLTLPVASLRGNGRGQVLFVVNAGAGTLTLKPSGNDSLNGSATLPAGATAVLFSDGVSRWHSTLVDVGPGAGVIGGNGIASITLDAQGRVTAVGLPAAAFVQQSRNLVSTADITLDGNPSATVNLSADRTIGLANAGAGVGGYGSHTALPVTVTLDAKGRVTGVTTQSTHVSIGSASDFTCRDRIGRRLVANAGTALVAGDFALSAGWGTTASVSVASGSRDTRGEFTVTSSGTGQGANPTITLTFKDGTFANAPFALVMRNGGSQPTVVNTWGTTTGSLVITFVGTPVAAQTYTFDFMVLG